MKPICLVDMDQILADCNKLMIIYYNLRFGTNFNENATDLYLSSHEIKNKEIDPYAIRECFLETGFWEKIPIIPGAIEGIKKLNKYFEIYILSTEYRLSSRCVYEKQQWLNRYFSEVADHSIFTKHKYMVKGNILIDDRVDNLKKWKEYNPDGITASLRYSWTDPKYTDIIGENWEQLTTLLLKV